MGGKKANKRRSYLAVKSSHKKTKSNLEECDRDGPTPANVANLSGSIVIDVAPEDDDDFVQTLVQVQKTQLCINRQNATRTTKVNTTMTTTADSSGQVVIPMTVRVPSVDYLIQKYGKYLAAKSKLESTSISSIHPAAEADNKTGRKLPKVVYKTEISELILGDGIAENISRRKRSTVNSSPLPGSSTNDVTKTTVTNINPKMNTGVTGCAKTVRRMTRSTSAGIGSDNTSFDSNREDGTVQTVTVKNSSAAKVTSPAPVLPKRVTFKKGLINDMLERTGSKPSTPKGHAGDDIRPGKSSSSSRTAPAPPPPTVSDKGDAHQEKVTVATTSRRLIFKQEMDPDSGLRIPRIETVSTITKSSGTPNVESVHGIVTSSDDDDDRDDDDNPVGDPDFDPSTVDLESFERSDQWKKNGQANSSLIKTNVSNSTTCETCNMRFLSISAFTIHMKECHNEYTSEEPKSSPSAQQKQNPKPTSVPVNCNICKLPFATELGLKIHMRQKHLNSNTGKKSKEVELDVEPLPQEPQLSIEPKQQQTVARILYVCSFPSCDQQFSSIQNMRIHKCLQHEHKPKESIDCFLCKAVAQQPGALLHHLKTSHPGEVDEEGYGEFARLGYIVKTRIVSPSTSSHKARGKEELKTYKCAPCNSIFKSEASLESHRRTFHGQSRTKLTVNYIPASKETSILASYLHKPPKSTGIDSEGLQEAEIINLCDSDDEAVLDKVAPEVRRLQGSIPSLIPIEPMPQNLEMSPATTASLSNTPLPVVTICPYCFKSLLFKDFPAHVEIHANMNRKSKKFQCPYTGCKESYNELPDLIFHHKSVHQERLKQRQKVADVSRPSEPEHITTLPSRENATTFMCNTCNNVTFPDMSSLLQHCQLLHGSKTGQQGQTEFGPEHGENIRRVIQPKTRVRISSTESVYPITMNGGSTMIKESSKLRMAIMGPAKPTSKYSEPNITTMTPSMPPDPHVAQPNIEVTPAIISRLFKCDLCRMGGFINQDELDRHIRTHSLQIEDKQPENPFECNLCAASFRNLEDINKHCTSFHHILTYNLPAECPMCKTLIKYARNMSRHITNVHKTPQCALCAQLFKTEEQCNRHMDLHVISGTNISDKPQYRCLECQQIFSATSRIFHHYRVTHSDGDKCTCVTCNIQLQRKNLQKHLEIHQRVAVESSQVASTSCNRMSLLQPPRYDTPGGNTFSQVRHMSTPGLQASVVVEGYVDEHILSDPLAEPGDSADTSIFNQSYNQTQFEFEDVTIGIGESAESYEDIGGLLTDFGEMPY